MVSPFPSFSRSGISESRLLGNLLFVPPLRPTDHAVGFHAENLLLISHLEAEALVEADVLRTVGLHAGVVSRRVHPDAGDAHQALFYAHSLQVFVHRQRTEVPAALPGVSPARRRHATHTDDGAVFAAGHQGLR